MTEIEQRRLVISESGTWLNTRFSMNACVKGAGVDCCRFIYACYAAAGIALPPDFPTFAPDWCQHKSEEKLLGIFEAHLHQVDTPLPGDAAIFRFGRCFSHAALVIAWPSVVHVMSGESCQWANAQQPPLVGRPVRYFSPWKQSVEAGVIARSRALLHSEARPGGLL